jgi:PAS domain S-box-containing protein
MADTPIPLPANILEHAAESIIAVNEDHQIIVFNKAAEKTFGYSAQEVLGQPLDLLIPDRLMKVHRKHVRKFAASRERSRPIEHRQGLVARRKDGSEFPVEIGISKLEADDSIIFMAIIVDITNRKHAEEEIQQMQDRFRVLVETLELDETLTRREREVLHLIAQGYASAEIADRLVISPRTVDMHRRHMVRKLGLSGQGALLRYALQYGITRSQE